MAELGSNNPALAGETYQRIAVDAATASSTAPAKAKTREFNHTVHGLRGVAAMMVFLAHVLSGVAENIYAGDPSYSGLVEGPGNFGRWGVWLFFVISGYVILPSVLRYLPGEFALRRFFRLYPLFFAFSLLFIALNAISNTYPDLNSPWTVVPGLLMINLLTNTQQLTPNAWSLSYEVLFYAMACAIVHFAVRRRSFLETLPFALFAIILLCRYPAMAFFLAGIAARLLDDRNIRPAPGPRIVLEMLAFAACVYCASARHYTFLPKDLGDWRTYGLYVGTALYFYMAIARGSLTSRLLDRPAILYLGTVSYSLYLAHPYTYLLMRKGFAQYGLFSDNWLLSVAIFLTAVTAVTLAFTHVVYRMLERYPYQWFFHERVFHR